jgi:hypothetical protein
MITLKNIYKKAGLIKTVLRGKNMTETDYVDEVLKTLLILFTSPLVLPAVLIVSLGSWITDTWLLFKEGIACGKYNMIEENDE